MVARFVGGQMEEWSTNYVYIKERGGFIPNNVGDPCAGVRGWTHWMLYSEYRRALETIQRED